MASVGVQLPDGTTRPTVAGDWGIQPLPEVWRPLRVDRVYSDLEMERIRLGRLPESQDDRWFVYCEGDEVFLHRSWTGINKFVARFSRKDDGGWRVVDAFITIERRLDWGTEYESQELAFVLDRLAGRPFGEGDVPEEPLWVFEVASSVLKTTPHGWIGSLDALDLMPPRYRGDFAGLGLVLSDVDYGDKYAGALLGGACGDALGRPAEGMPPSRIRSRYGVLRDFEPWRGYREGPIGTITDDTQLTMCIAESIAEQGLVDPEDIARRFVEWLPVGRGRGRTCVAAINNLQTGREWDEAGVNSAGNGAAMRVAPVGLLHSLDVDRLRMDAAFSSVVTHRHPMAVVSSIAQAFSVAYCLHRRPEDFDIAHFAGSLAVVLADLRDPGEPERKPGTGSRPVPLAERIQEVFRMLDDSAETAFAYLHNGAFVLESLPAAMWCFLKHFDDPEAAIVTAANGGYDAHTVAAMAGNLAGALHGAAALPGRWLDELEYRRELVDLAEGIRALSG